MNRAGLLAWFVLTAVALPVLALAPACLALAAYLVAIGTPSGPVLALFLVLLSLVIRPRVLRLSPHAVGRSEEQHAEAVRVARPDRGRQ